MKKQIVKFLMLVLVFLSTKNISQAQTQSIENYTLQQCIDYALENYNSIKNSELDVQSAAAKVGEIRGMGLPQLSGSVSITDNPTLKRMFLQGGSTIAPPGSDPNSVVAIPNFFQLRTTGDASLTLNQLLFDGSYLMGLKASKVYNELATKSLLQTKIQVVESVTKAFYMVLINNEQYELVKANAARLDTLLGNTEAYYKEGFVEEIDVNRIEVARNNLNAELTKFTQLNKMTYLLLKFQMGMNLEDSLTLAGDIKDIKVGEISGALDVNPENRVEYSILKTQKELSLLDVKNNRAKYLPTLSGFANGGFTRSDLTVAQTLQHTWYPYLMWGVNLRIPIVAGGSTVYKVRQAKYQYAKSENNLNQFSKTVELQVRQSVISLENEMQNIQIQERNLELAKKIVKAAEARLTVGSGSNIEVVDAENAFKTAQTNYYNAIYSLLVAKLEFEKSKGTLYSE
jgi:outer membrane protein